jgi:hypothetical protein
MGLSLGNLEFRGLVGEPTWGPVEFRRLEQQYFGQNGATEIVGGRGGQDIDLPWWIDDFFPSAASLRTYIRLVELQYGKHDTLTYTGESSFALERTTFLELRLTSGPMQPTGTATGWWAQARLKFRSLQP